MPHNQKAKGLASTLSELGSIRLLRQKSKDNTPASAPDTFPQTPCTSWMAPSRFPITATKSAPVQPGGDRTANGKLRPTELVHGVYDIVPCIFGIGFHIDHFAKR